ncbi:MAG: chemotaxis protein CheW [bacterium]|nr:chemotaxis protein CheW [bacterium]
MDDQPIDWQSLRRELEWEQSNRQEDTNLRRLQQRARQYAALLPNAQVDEVATASVLAFQLGRERYALDVMLVRSVRTAGKITAVPGVPYFYPGVVNLRGQITTVLDLSAFFDVQSGAAEPARELILVQANALELALLAHHIEGVVQIPLSQIEPLPDVRYARGVTPDGIVLLDILTVFEDERLIVGSTQDRID